MLKSFRYLLFPLSMIYGAIIWVRNWLYDKNILRSSSFNFPIINIGNLAIGGTGKTPMTEYLVELLLPAYKVAILSRGYKRKTQGYALATDTATALEIGDEPMQFHKKFPGIPVAVGEERVVAIPQLLHDRPETEVILLDDAFQHRQVRAGLNILLTECQNLFTRDFIMPAGDLRDVASSSKRADIIIVTKCKDNLSAASQAKISHELNPKDRQQVFFTEMEYGTPYSLENGDPYYMTGVTDVLLVCGIANPRPLQDYLTSHVHSFDMLRFADHHIFKIDDLKSIKTHYARMDDKNAIIITTEKDAVRLEKYSQELEGLPIYILPIRHKFLFNEAEAFASAIYSFIGPFKERKPA
ncbi:MAG: tetraacyldisaccharide 4'-kinase [Ferruginibacter sp.]